MRPRVLEGWRGAGCARPAAGSRFAALQLGADAETIHAYARRQQTVSEHQQRIGEYLRLRAFDAAAGERLARFLKDEALRLERTASLLARARAWLRDGSRLDLARTLDEGNEQSTGGFRLLRSNRARAVLAVAQVALALVLLTGAGLLLRSFVRLITVDRGYDPANVIAAGIRNPDITFRPDMPPESMLTAGRRFQTSLVDEIDRLAVLSDVGAVGVSSSLPLASGGGSAAVFRVAGTAPPTDPRDLQQARVNVVSPGYFDAMRLRLRSGPARRGREPAGAGGERDARSRALRRRAGRRTAPAAPVGAGPEPWEVIGVSSPTSATLG